MLSLNRSFPRYDEGGAYHWVECDPNSGRFNPGLVARYDAVIKRVPFHAKVLDVGCGDGYLMHMLSGIADEVIGIDPEPGAIELAAEKLKADSNCRVICGSAYDLCFPERTFDVAILADVIEHLEDPLRALREAARVIRDDGIVIISTPRMRERRVSKYHVKEFSAAEMNSMLSDCFASVIMTGLWPMVWIRLWETRVGFRVFPRLVMWLGNPLRREGVQIDKFAMILAICRLPRRDSESISQR